MRRAASFAAALRRGADRWLFRVGAPEPAPIRLTQRRAAVGQAVRGTDHRGQRRTQVMRYRRQQCGTQAFGFAADACRFQIGHQPRTRGGLCNIVDHRLGQPPLFEREARAGGFKTQTSNTAYAG